MTISRHASKLVTTSTRSLNGIKTLNAKRYASTALPSNTISIDEKLVRLARQTLSKAAANAENGTLSNNESSSSNNDGEAAKKKKNLETLRDALRNWQEVTDVCLK